mgnify:FL=1
MQYGKTVFKHAFRHAAHGMRDSRYARAHRLSAGRKCPTGWTAGHLHLPIPWMEASVDADGHGKPHVAQSRMPAASHCETVSAEQPLFSARWNQELPEDDLRKAALSTAKQRS